jgi:hypothetical protein
VISSDAHRGAGRAPALTSSPSAAAVRGAQYMPPASSPHRDVIGQQTACPAPRQY